MPVVGSVVIPMLVLFVVFFISSRVLGDRQKRSPFECGFDPKELVQLPFSFRFFLVTVIFLIFDIELALVIPLPFVLLSPTNRSASILGVFFFFFVLVVGTLYEWLEGSLDWMV